MPLACGSGVEGGLWLDGKSGGGIELGPGTGRESGPVRDALEYAYLGLAFSMFLAIGGN